MLLVSSPALSSLGLLASRENGASRDNGRGSNPPPPLGRGLYYIGPIDGQNIELPTNMLDNNKI